MNYKQIKAEGEKLLGEIFPFWLKHEFQKDLSELSVCCAMELEFIQRRLYAQSIWTVGEPATERQEAAIAALSRKIGWKGLSDQRLVAFIERTLKVKFIKIAFPMDVKSYLSKQMASQIIVGLDNFNQSLLKRKQHDSNNQNPICRKNNS